MGWGGLMGSSPQGIGIPIQIDSNKNVLANINAQNIDPVAASVTGAVGSVTGAVGSVTGAVGSVTGAVGSVTNPVNVSTLISHQTGLSVTANASNTPYNIGSAISITQNGIARIMIIAHVSAGNGEIQLNITRGAKTYNLGLISQGSTLFYTSGSSYITSPSPTMQLANSDGGTYTLEILLLNGDSLQFQAGNNTAGDITYLDDLLVVLQ
jgi:hypothetical protein